MFSRTCQSFESVNYDVGRNPDLQKGYWMSSDPLYSSCSACDGLLRASQFLMGWNGKAFHSIVRSPEERSNP